MSEANASNAGSKAPLSRLITLVSDTWPLQRVPLLHVMIIAGRDINLREVVQKLIKGESAFGNGDAKHVLNLLVLIAMAERVTVAADGAVIGIANDPKPTKRHGITISSLFLQRRLFQNL